jgi:hypothetical protein
LTGVEEEAEVINEGKAEDGEEWEEEAEEHAGEEWMFEKYVLSTSCIEIGEYVVHASTRESL